MGSYAGIVAGQGGDQKLILRNASISRRARIDGDSFLQDGSDQRLRLGVLQGISQYQEELVDTDCSQSTVTQWADFNGNLSSFGGGFDNVSDEQATPVVRDGVWKIVAGTTGSTNAVFIDGLLSESGYYRVRITYYIPTTNTQVADFRFAFQTGGTSVFFFRNEASAGAWKTMEETLYVDSEDPVIVLTDSADSTSGVTSGDVMYIANAQIHKVATLQSSAYSENAIENAAHYDSDFSSGADGWSGDSSVTRTGNIDGVVDDNGTSYDDCLRMELDVGTTSQFRSWKIFSPTAGTRYKVEMTIYIPTANTNVDGFYMFETTLLKAITHARYLSTVPGEHDFVPGVWTDIEFEYTSEGSSGLYMNPRNGSSGNFATSSGDSDFLYLASFKVTEVDNIPPQFSDASSGNGELEHFSGNHNAADESGRTETGCLKYSASITNGTHYFDMNGVTTLNKSYRLIIRYYIPTTNTSVDRVDVESGGGTGSTTTRILRGVITDFGSWRTIAVDFRATGENLNFLVFSGGAATFTGTRGDDSLIYFKEISCFPLENDEIFYPIGFTESTDYAFEDLDSGFSLMRGNYDGVSDGTTSYDQCYRIDITGSGAHRIVMRGVTVGTEYRFYMRYYVPSTNSHCDGLRIDDGGSVRISTNYTTSGSWQTIDTTFTASGDNRIIITPTDGSTGSITPTTTDYVYFQVIEIVPNQPEIDSGDSVREYEVGMGTTGSKAGSDASVNNGVMVGTAISTDETGSPKIGPTFWYDSAYRNPCWTLARYKTRNDTTNIDQVRGRVIVNGTDTKNASSLFADSYDVNLTFGISEDSQLSMMPLFLTFIGGSSPSDSLTIYGHYLHGPDADSSGIQLAYTVSDFDTDIQEVDDSSWGQSILYLDIFISISNAIDTSDGNLNTFTLNWPSETHELTIAKLGGVIAPSA